MSHKPDIAELEDATRYDKALTLPYGELAPFVIRSLRAINLPMTVIWMVLGLSAFLSVWLWPGVRYHPEQPQVIKGLMTGLVVLPVLLIPVHEALHLIPFRLAGAKDIRYGADLRQGIVYVTAHHFVAGIRLFSAVAVTPFAVISSSLAVVMVFCSPWCQWTLSLALMAHTTMCAGDAALIGFMRSLGRHDIYTWDDADKKEAYFYAKKIS